MVRVSVPSRSVGSLTRQPSNHFKYKPDGELSCLPPRGSTVAFRSFKTNPEDFMRSLKEMVVNNQKVRFTFYRDGQLWYETECGFRFPVPISDAGTATFMSEDRAILFMRYIRKQIAALAEARTGQT
jgi:hypothetical protein